MDKFQFFILSADGQGSYKFIVDDVTNFVAGGGFACSETQELSRVGALGTRDVKDDKGIDSSSPALKVSSFIFLALAWCFV